MKWPPLAPNEPAPVWTGRDFLIGTTRAPILRYHRTESGWTGDLTQMHEETAGENHFIDEASRKNAINSLSPILKQPDTAILEVGCSSGFLLEELQRKASHAFLVGSDFIESPLIKLAGRLRGIPIVQFDITKCPLPDSSFEGIVLLNVLEHIEDDLKALREVYRLLKPGGLAYIEVPAGPHLYDFYDKHLMHYRRYKAKDLRLLAEKAGFTVERSSHLGFFIYPSFAMVKKRNRQREERMTDAERKSKVCGQIKQSRGSLILHALMSVELAIGKYITYPTGIRCVMTLKK